jgi:hypothetical protein
VRSALSVSTTRLMATAAQENRATLACEYSKPNRNEDLD